MANRNVINHKEGNTILYIQSAKDFNAFLVKNIWNKLCHKPESCQPLIPPWHENCKTVLRQVMSVVICFRRGKKSKGKCLKK